MPSASLAEMSQAIDAAADGTFTSPDAELHHGLLQSST
jgi:hypothetical protein